MVSIYCLIDPRDGNPKYIGKSIDPINRFKIHVFSCNLKVNTKKNAWIKKLKKLGLIPILEILDIVPINEWQFWERHYISLYKSWNFELKNMTIGGDGSSLLKLSEEHKKKISISTSKALKGRIKTVEHCNSISKAKLGKPLNLTADQENHRVLKLKESNSIKKSKKVIQYDQNNSIIAEYNSIKEARIKTGAQTIGKVCKGLFKSSNGFIWKYKEDLA